MCSLEIKRKCYLWEMTVFCSSCNDYILKCVLYFYNHCFTCIATKFERNNCFKDMCIFLFIYSLPKQSRYIQYKITLCFKIQIRTPI